MTDIVTHPTCQQVTALSCVDVAHLAIEGIAGLARLLGQAIAHGAPVGVSELAAVSNAMLQDAGRLDASLALWRRLPAYSLPDSRYRSLLRRVDTLRQHADDLGHAALCADSGMPPTADQLATLAGHLLALAGLLRQAVKAAHTACIVPPPAQPLH